MSSNATGWIGVDLDGTLAKYDCDPEQGPPLDCHFNPYLPGTDLAEECDRGWCEFYGK